MSSQEEIDVRKNLNRLIEKLKEKYPGDDDTDEKRICISLEESAYFTEESLYAGISDTESGK